MLRPLTIINDRLAGLDLCQLIPHIIPEHLHRPIVFQNQTTVDGRRTRPDSLGSYHCGADPDFIEINLHAIVHNGIWHRHSSLGAAVWIRTIEVLLHEVGHVATTGQYEHITADAYAAGGRGYDYCEYLADLWASRRIMELLEHSPTLFQPTNITGYLGARVATAWHGASVDAYVGKGKSSYVRERRCRKSGAQFTAGDVLAQLGIHPIELPGVYAALRKLSEGLGIDYVDGAGRIHKLYVIADLPILRDRFHEAGLLCATCPHGNLPSLCIACLMEELSREEASGDNPPISLSSAEGSTSDAASQCWRSSRLRNSLPRVKEMSVAMLWVTL